MAIEKLYTNVPKDDTFEEGKVRCIERKITLAKVSFRYSADYLQGYIRGLYDHSILSTLEYDYLFNTIKDRKGD